MTAVVGPTAPPARRTRAPAPSAVRRWGWAATAATAAAGFLHAVAAIDHGDAGDLVIAFFLVTALGQLAAAAGLGLAAVTGQRPAAGPLAALLALTVGLVALYLVAHTTGLLSGVTAVDPLGGDHAHADWTGPVALGDSPPVQVEASGLLGTATVAVEMFSVLAFLALLPQHRRRRAGNVLAVLGGAAWLLWLTGVLG